MLNYIVTVISFIRFVGVTRKEIENIAFQSHTQKWRKFREVQSADGYKDRYVLINPFRNQVANKIQCASNATHLGVMTDFLLARQTTVEALFQV